MSTTPLTLTDFKQGQALILTYRNRDGEERRSAWVSLVNYNNLGGVTYVGRYASGLLETGSGWFKPEELGTKRFGLVGVEIVADASPAGYGYGSQWQPRPGDRGYDPM